MAASDAARARSTQKPGSGTKRNTVNKVAANSSRPVAEPAIAPEETALGRFVVGSGLSIMSSVFRHCGSGKGSGIG